MQKQNHPTTSLSHVARCYQQMVYEGTFCDVITRVTLQQATASTDNEETSPQHYTEDIPCHSNVLSKRSDYFDRALRAGFKEKETKIVCITHTQDEEDLSISSCYLHVLSFSFISNCSFFAFRSCMCACCVFISVPFTPVLFSFTLLHIHTHTNFCRHPFYS